VTSIKAHENAVTCLACDGKQIVSGGEDGVKVWDLQTGKLTDEISSDIAAAWQIGMDEERIVVGVSKNDRAVMEVSPSSQTFEKLKC
jgi:WD40 repeat protein